MAGATKTNTFMITSYTEQFDIFTMGRLLLGNCILKMLLGLLRYCDAFIMRRYLQII